MFLCIPRFSTLEACWIHWKCRSWVRKRKTKCVDEKALRFHRPHFDFDIGSKLSSFRFWERRRRNRCGLQATCTKWLEGRSQLRLARKNICKIIESIFYSSTYLFMFYVCIIPFSQFILLAPNLSSRSLLIFNSHTILSPPLASNILIISSQLPRDQIVAFQISAILIVSLSLIKETSSKQRLIPFIWYFLNRYGLEL